MAEFIGKDGIHNISGACELCGAVCDPSTEELNCLSCTFQQCDAGLYHQDCLEKFLKRTGCEKNRKTGFQCPRGRGKLKSDPCPGRIDKSHPIHPRKEEKKKAKVAEPVQQPKKFGPVAKEARRKEKEERDRQKALQRQKEEEQRRQAAREAAAAKKGKHAAVDTQRAKALVETIRRGMGVGGSTSDVPPPLPQQRELLTLDDYEAARGSSAHSNSIAQNIRPAPALNAWNAKPTPLLDQEQLASTEVFPAIPGSKVRTNGASTVAAQRAWKGSVAGSDKSDISQAPPGIDALQVKPPPPPPPPPGRHDTVFQEGVGQAMHRAPTNVHSRGPGVRMSHHSSEASQHSNDTLFASGLHMDHQLQSNGSIVSSRIGVLDEASASLSGEPKLTKTQKKNMKRAGKKAQQNALEGSESSGTYDDAALTQQCMACIAHFKAMCFLQGLMAMGFDHWLCMAAIRRMGIDGNAATGWILDRQSEEFSGTKHSWLHDALTYIGPAMQVDVSFEMEMVEGVCTALPVGYVMPLDVLHAVIDAKGNVQQALLTVLEQARQLEGSWPESHVGTAGALAVLNEQ